MPIQSKAICPQCPVIYIHTVPIAPDGFWESDWKNLGFDWAIALSLGVGLTDGYASIARMLTQMIPPLNSSTNTTSLSTSLPSIAEAFAVMAGSTLLAGAKNAPFVHFWNESTNPAVIQMDPQHRPFNAKFQYKDYSSGESQSWQNLFYVVLALVFLPNLFCLVWLLVVGLRQITDWTDPLNLFALALNSPSSKRLAGACGTGPEGKMLSEKWSIAMDEENEHFYMHFRKDDEEAHAAGRSRGSKNEEGCERVRTGLRTVDSADTLVAHPPPLETDVTDTEVGGPAYENVKLDDPVSEKDRTTPSPTVAQFRNLMWRKVSGLW